MYGHGHDSGDADNMDDPPSKRYRRDETADPINPNPSVVVHVRNLCVKATEADLLEALANFGPIAYALVRRPQQMALVEFEDIEGATACVTFAAENQIYVAGQPALFNYSTSQGIQRMGFECEKPNHVLVLGISNVKYPISVDVLYEICSSQGQVLRINIVKRNHFITALVEFPSADIAKTVKHAINGADIYSGCCTLKVEFARVDTVRITRHDQDQRDYTLPADAFEAAPNPVRKPLIASPDAGGVAPYAGAGAGTVLNDYGYPPAHSAPSYGRGGSLAAAYRGAASRDMGYPPAEADPYAHGDPYAQPPRDPYAGRDPYAAPEARRDPYGGYGGPPAPGYGYDDFSGGDRPEGGQGCVVMVYGLDQSKISCDIVFNIFCQYGNVLRVKFMRNKTDTAMVELGTPDQAQNVLKYLQGIKLFGMTIELKPSFQEGIREVIDPFDMPDGSPSYRDYSASRNQRFSTPDLAARNRLSYPTTVLHWYNSPPEMDGERITELFTERKAPAPISTFVFASKSERSSSGTADFASVEDANEALALSNHTPVVSPAGKAPFIVKMSYTHPRGPRFSGEANGEEAQSERGSSGGERGGYRGRGRGRGGFRGEYRGGGGFRGRGRGSAPQRDSYAGGVGYH